MAYVTTNPPRLYVQAVEGGPNIWLYTSADAIATVVAANYITNAKDLGMKVGDILFVVDTATPKLSSTSVTTVAAAGSTCSTGQQLS